MIVQELNIGRGRFLSDSLGENLGSKVFAQYLPPYCRPCEAGRHCGDCFCTCSRLGDKKRRPASPASRRSVRVQRNSLSTIPKTSCCAPTKLLNYLTNLQAMGNATAAALSLITSPIRKGRRPAAIASLKLPSMMANQVTPQT